MAKATDNAFDLNGAVCQENDINDDVSLNLQITPFGGVFRFGLFQKLNRGIGRSVIAGLLFRGSLEVSTAPNPLATTVPFLPLPPGGGVAVPFPKPVLGTVPRMPSLPPVPFPYPSPPGSAVEPRRLALVA